MTVSKNHLISGLTKAMQSAKRKGDYRSAAQLRSEIQDLKSYSGDIIVSRKEGKK